MYKIAHKELFDTWIQDGHDKVFCTPTMKNILESSECVEITGVTHAIITCIS